MFEGNRGCLLVFIIAILALGLLNWLIFGGEM